jgi:signal transduction histidine kinase
MRVRSLRAQLALWHAGLLAVTLVSLAGLTYLVLLRVLHSRADAAIERYAETTGKKIAALIYRSQALAPPVPPAGPRTSGGGPAVPLGPGAAPAGAARGASPHFLDRDPQSWGRYVQVIDRYGNVVEASDALRSLKLPRSPTAVLRGLRGEVTFETVPDLGEYPLRVVTVPVQMGEEVPYLVQAGSSLEGVEAALQRASVILLILTPSVFLVALLGGSALVSRALRPVDELTHAAMEIEHRHLDRRVVPPRPDDEIGRLAGAFNEMLSRLDRSFRQIQQFSADASHELKTPLTAIRGEAEVALMGELTREEYQQTLRSIVEEVGRMSAVVDNLLTLARADADQVTMRCEPVALHEVVMAVFEGMEAMARQKGVALDLYEVAEAAMSGDALWLQQAISNLVANAVKYTPAGGRIWISLIIETSTSPPGEPGSEVSGTRAESSVPALEAGPPDDITGPATRSEALACLTVRDTGIGIPSEHLPHVFDRFYRVDSGRSRESGGTGLGLSIVRWVVEAHGGRVGVESTVGKGSTFTVRLPLAARPSAHDPVAAESPSASRSRHSAT